MAAWLWVRNRVKPSAPHRLTVGQALAIALMLIIGIVFQQNGQVLLFLVIVLGVVAFVLNRLFAWVLYLVTRNDAPPDDTDT